MSFADLVPEDDPQPLVRPAVRVPISKAEPLGEYVQLKPQPRNGVHPAWVAVLAFFTMMFFLLWLSTWNIMPGPEPHPDPNVDPVDGSYVAIFYDDKQKGEYTADQITAMDSVDTAQFLDDNVSGWHKIDVEPMEDLSKLGAIYVEMAKEHRPKLPWAVVRSGKKLGSELITDSDELKKLIKRTIK